MVTRDKIVAIVGPTASGKSDLAMRLASNFGGEIICADSRTIYKGMDIGTAKPSKTDRQLIKHYGLDLVDPDQRYSAADFQAMAKKALLEISGRDKLPIIVGGSGLYIDGLLYNYRFNPHQEVDGIDGMGLAELQELAKRLGIQVSEQTFTNQRHLAGLIKRGGQPSQKDHLMEGCIFIGLNPGSNILDERIERRVELIFKTGFIDEVEKLLKKFPAYSAGFNAPGYLPAISYLNQKIDLENAKMQFIKNDKKLATKQMTWFKRNPDIKWFDSPDKAESYILNLWS
jgi:tRNA dimethylallyltransferase